MFSVFSTLNSVLMYGRKKDFEDVRVKDGNSLRSRRNQGQKQHAVIKHKFLFFLYILIHGVWPGAHPRIT